MPNFDSKSPTTSLKQSSQREKQGKMLISVILPGVKPTLLGNALRSACPDTQLHWTTEGEFADEKVASGATADQTITFWAMMSQPFSHIVHGKEVMGFWRNFSEALWITYLGNPLWRAMDTYRNILKNATHPLHDELVESGLPLRGFYASEMSRPVCNRQCGKLMMASRIQATNPDVLFSEAWERLERFSWIGLEGIDMGPQPHLARLLQAEKLSTTIPVIEKQKPPKTVLDWNTASAITEANRADFKLWDLMRRRRLLRFFTDDKTR